jgi:[acyl-carrier-protein] S-malonyltransferase
MKTNWAAIFPGQGSQHPGMGREIFDNFKVAQLAYEEASDACKLDLKRLCFDSSENDLKLTANTQPALLITSIAMWRALTSECNAKPKVTLGHSLGEYSALVAAGALSLSDAIVTVRVRGLAMQEAVPAGTGGMYAVLGLHDDSVIKACSDMQKKASSDGGLKSCVIEAANFNSPGQVVISGHLKALEYFKEHFIGADYGSSRVKLISLAVSAPFHSSLMKPAAERLKPQLEKVKWADKFEIPVIHNVNVEINQKGLSCIENLYHQVTRPVLWTSSIRHAKELEILNYVEVGAGRILSGLVKKTDPGLHTHHLDTVESLKQTMSFFAD